jgi:hypothetical protein
MEMQTKAALSLSLPQNAQEIMKKSVVRATRQKNSLRLWNTKGHYCIQRSLPLAPIPSQLNQLKYSSIS